MENNPTWITVVAIALGDGEGRWLMQRRPQGKPHAGLWEFPGGKVESAELPSSALVREIAEELGIAIAEAALEPAGFAESSACGTHPGIVILLYTCRAWDGEAQSLEGGEIGWFTPDQVAALDRPALDRDLCRSLFGEGSG